MIEDTAVSCCGYFPLQIQFEVIKLLLAKYDIAGAFKSGVYGYFRIEGENTILNKPSRR